MSALRIQFREELDSTQMLAAEYVKAGERRVDAVQAAYQTAGRGRWGRKWVAPKRKNLCITYLLWEFPLPAKAWELGFIMAVAVCEAVEDEIMRACEDWLEHRPLLRWPNDIMLDGKKLAGILLETAQTSFGESIAIIGVGVNVNFTGVPDEIVEIATSLMLLTGVEHNIDELAQAIWDRFHALYPALNANPTALAALWRERNGTSGKRYLAPDGRQGVASGITDDCQLIIEWPGGEQTLLPVAAALGTDS